MKIAVLTFHRAYNCGAVLQAWALQKSLQGLGHAVVFPDCNDIGHAYPYSKLNKFGRGTAGGVLRWIYANTLGYNFLLLKKWLGFTLFTSRHLNHRRPKDRSFGDYDLVVVGSDQVWNFKSPSDKYFSLFTGKGVNPIVPLVGYALSAGDARLTFEVQKMLSQCARDRFARVSYRERYLRDALEVDGPVVCDPTLLLSREDYREVECSKRLVKGDYLFVYSVNSSEEVMPIACQLSRKLNVKLVVADVYRYSRVSVNGIKNDYPCLTPDKMLALIRDAKYVIASSFHGCVFSVIYNKAFLNLYKEEKVEGNNAMGRQQAFLEDVGLISRRFSTTGKIEDMVKILSTEFFVAEKIRQLGAKGRQYLEAVSKIGGRK